MKPSAIPRSQYSPPWCHASLVDGNDPASFRLSFLDGPASGRKHLWVVPLICPIGLLYVVQKSQLLATLLINLGSFKWNPGPNDRGKDLIHGAGMMLTWAQANLKGRYFPFFHWCWLKNKTPTIDDGKTKSVVPLGAIFWAAACWITAACRVLGVCGKAMERESTISLTTCSGLLTWAVWNLKLWLLWLF